MLFLFNETYGMETELGRSVIWKTTEFAYNSSLPARVSGRNLKVEMSL